MQVYEEKIEKTYENEQRLYDLTRDYQTSMRNYQDLLQKRLNSKLSEELEKRQKGERFRIIDPAHLPDTPYKPDRMRIVFMGSMLSVGLTVGLCMLREHARSGSIKQAEELEGSFGLPVLVSVPWNSISHQNRYLVSAEAIDSIVTEQYRVLYTNLIRSTAHRDDKVLAITSAIPNEGKTISTLNLGVIMARDFGRNVMILEGDLKKLALSQFVTATASRYQAEKVQDILPDLLHQTPESASLPLHTPFASQPLSFVHKNLTVLPAEQVIWNASSILSSGWMTTLLEHLKLSYDMVLIDAPPILPLSDMNIYRGVVDGIIIVVKAESTKRKDIDRCIQAFGTDQVIGFVLNGVQQQLPSYYRKYAYN